MLRLGIIGCGRFAHLYHVPAALARTDARLVAVCDPRPSEETRRLATEQDVQLYASLEDLLSSSSVDAVVVSSPHGMHAQQVRRCLEANLHVLVDKPFVLHAEEAIALATLAAERALVGAVAFNRRFDHGFRFARDAIARGMLGTVCYVESIQLGYPSGGWYDDPVTGGGGPFVGRGTHLADAVPWILGCSVDAVSAELVRPWDSGRDGGGFISARLGVVTWRATVLEHASWNHDEVRVFGDEASLRIWRPESESFNWEVEHRDLAGRARERPALGQVSYALDDFVDAISTGAEPTCTFAGAVHSVAVIEAAYEAARIGSVPWIEVKGPAFGSWTARK